MRPMPLHGRARPCGLSLVTKARLHGAPCAVLVPSRESFSTENASAADLGGLMSIPDVRPVDATTPRMLAARGGACRRGSEHREQKESRVLKRLFEGHGCAPEDAVALESCNADLVADRPQLVSNWSAGCFGTPTASTWTNAEARRRDPRHRARRAAPSSRTGPAPNPNSSGAKERLEVRPYPLPCAGRARAPEWKTRPVAGIERSFEQLVVIPVPTSLPDHESRGQTPPRVPGWCAAWRSCSP